MKIAVLGSGGWGTALAMLLAENGHTVTLWSYLEEESRRLQQTRENPLLPGVTLPESLSYTWDGGHPGDAHPGDHSGLGLQGD